MGSRVDVVTLRDQMVRVARFGATSEYPATHALLKSTAPVVLGPYSASEPICIDSVLN